MAKLVVPELPQRLQLPELVLNATGNEWNIRFEEGKDIRDVFVDVQCIVALWRQFGKSICERRQGMYKGELLSLAQGFLGSGVLLEHSVDLSEARVAFPSLINVPLNSAFGLPV